MLDYANMSTGTLRKIVTRELDAIERERRRTDVSEEARAALVAEREARLTQADAVLRLRDLGEAR